MDLTAGSFHEALKARRDSEELAEGRRKFSGRLEGVEDGRVVLTCDAERVEVPLDEVKKCKVKPDFSNSGK